MFRHGLGRHRHDARTRRERREKPKAQKSERRAPPQGERGRDEEREHERVAASTRAALGDDAFDQAWREGSAMELEEAVRYALNGQLAEGT